MRLGVDYDDTWTLDPVFWRAVVELAAARGHEVVIVSNRGPSRWEPIAEEHALPVRVIYADGKPKTEAVRAAGLVIDVWVEDMPHRVNFGWQHETCIAMGLERRE
jgi:hypothetical protein